MEIQNELDIVSRGRTTLTIAHRLSTIVGVDKIIVLKNGVIAEQGSHQELIDLKGEYFGLWEKQNRILELEEQLETHRDALSRPVKASK